MGVGEILSKIEKDIIKLSGVIKEAHKGGLFRVEVDTGSDPMEILARPSGKMKKFGIKLVIGDLVDVELSPFDLTKGRIVYRSK